MSKQVGCTPTSFLLLSFHPFIALVHPLHGNPYSLHWHQLMGISLAQWLAASMWDFILFCLLQITPFIIFYSTYSAISMAHTHILRESWKSLRLLKYETIAWLVIGVVHDESIIVWRKWSMTKLYDFVGMNFLWPCYLRRHDCLVSMLEVLLFLCQY